MKDGVKVFIKNEILGKYLFILRDDKPNIPQPNTWSLPGGGIEIDETPLETLIREIEEELNIDIFDIKHIYSKEIKHNFENQEYKIIGHYFTAKTDALISDINLTEGQKVEFFTLEEIEKYDNISFGIKETLKNYKYLL